MFSSRLTTAIRNNHIPIPTHSGDVNICTKVCKSCCYVCYVCNCKVAFNTVRSQIGNSVQAYFEHRNIQMIIAKNSHRIQKIQQYNKRRARALQFEVCLSNSIISSHTLNKKGERKLMLEQKITRQRAQRAHFIMSSLKYNL